MRNTKQKELIFEIINESRSHLSAQETYNIARKKINNISLGTVYRILNNLVDSNKIIRLTTKSGIDHFDRIPDVRHSHFICDVCNKIYDIDGISYSINSDMLNKFTINDVEITLTGICDECTKGK